MKNKICIILTLSFLSIPLFAQITQENTTISPFWNMYSDNYLNTPAAGRGYTGIGFTGDLSSTSLNPASLDIDGKYQAEIHYSYKTTQPWLTFISNDINLSQNLFSFSAGFAMKINKHLQAGLLYSNPSTLTLNLGEIIRTNEFGQEIGRYEAWEKVTVHSFSLPVVYKWSNFSAGASINFAMYRSHSNATMPDLPDGYTWKSDRFSGQAGLLFMPTKQLSFGASFLMQSNGKAIINDGNIHDTTTANMPMKIGAGASYLINKLRLFADYTFTNASIRSGEKDMHQVHAGAEYEVNKSFTVRAGGFNYPDPRDFLTANWGESAQYDYKQVFLTFGATFKIKNLSINAAILDSHISSGFMKNTYVNAGLVYNFMK